MFFREKAHSALFFAANNNLKPPYQIIIDTNFINFSIQNKLDVFRSMMDCLLAKCKLRESCRSLINLNLNFCLIRCAMRN